MGHDSGTGYPRMGSWGADRGRVLAGLENLTQLAGAAAKEVRDQERKLIRIETLLEERASDIESLETQVSKVRHDHNQTKTKQGGMASEVSALQGELEKLKTGAAELKETMGTIKTGFEALEGRVNQHLEEYKVLDRSVTQMRARSALALGGGGVAGGGALVGIIELIRHLMG